MAFEGFSADTLHFLFENRMHDSRAWFEEHRKTYNTLVLSPLRELTAALAPAMLQIDPQINTGRCISRIYRDTRFSRDKTLFRDKMWMVFTRGRRSAGEELPGFYFEVNQEGYLYGCGYYMAGRETMDELRRMILADDPAFRAARRALHKQNLFALGGECYRRSKFPGQSAPLRDWLDRKTLEFTHVSHDFATLFSPRLASELAAGFETLRLVYAFLCKADERRLRRAALAADTPERGM